MQVVTTNFNSEKFKSKLKKKAKRYFASEYNNLDQDQLRKELNPSIRALEDAESKFTSTKPIIFLEKEFFEKIPNIYSLNRDTLISLVEQELIKNIPPKLKIKCGQLDSLKSAELGLLKLIVAGVNPNAQIEAYAYPTPLLSFIHQIARPETIIKMLIFYGADMDYYNAAIQQVTNSLALACICGHIKIVKILLKLGANPNIVPGLINMALDSDHIEIAKLLVNAGAHINVPQCTDDGKQLTTLDHAVLLGQPELVNLILNRADLDLELSDIKKKLFAYASIQK